jgi:hypothetical protein
MDLSLIPWGTIILIAIAAVGLVQWLKGAFKKAPSWIWAIASAILCIGLAAGTFYVSAWILYAAVALSFAQLCYEIIVQGIPEIVKRLISGQPAATSSGSPPPGAANPQ